MQDVRKRPETSGNGKQSVAVRHERTRGARGGQAHLEYMDTRFFPLRFDAYSALSALQNASS